MNRLLRYSIVVGVVCVIALIVYVYTKNTCKIYQRIQTVDGLVEIVDNTCEEGLPHTTTADVIRMTRDIWDSHRREEILRHERIHLDQKRRPDVWQAFYRLSWDYDILPSAPVQLDSLHELRPNPDTLGKPWAVWRKRYLFFPTYSGEHTLRDASVRVYDMETKQFVEVPPEWRSMFCHEGKCPHQYEHPHEMAAEYVTHGSKAPAALKLFAWRK